MQTIIEIKEIIHANFKNLLAKLYLILVYCFGIVSAKFVSNEFKLLYRIYEIETYNCIGMLTARPLVSLFK